MGAVDGRRVWKKSCSLFICFKLISIDHEDKFAHRHTNVHLSPTWTNSQSLTYSCCWHVLKYTCPCRRATWKTSPSTSRHWIWFWRRRFLKDWIKARTVMWCRLVTPLLILSFQFFPSAHTTRVRALIHDMYERTQSIVASHATEVKDVATYLLEHETIHVDDFERIVGVPKSKPW